MLRKGVSNNSIPTFEGKSNNNFETGGKLIADLERLERKLQDVYNSAEIKKPAENGVKYSLSFNGQITSNESKEVIRIIKQNFDKISDNLGVVINAYKNNGANKFYLHEAEIMEAESSSMTGSPDGVDTVNESASKDSIREAEQKSQENSSEQNVKEVFGFGRDRAEGQETLPQDNRRGEAVYKQHQKPQDRQKESSRLLKTDSLIERFSFKILTVHIIV